MNRLMSPLVQLFVRWMPDAFAVALMLTLLTGGLSGTVAGYPADAALASWGDSFWNLLRVTIQITLTLLR